MTVLHVKYLLVGGGVASYAAARAIRELDAEGSLLLVGQEINRPYHRPPLSKAFLRRQTSRESLFAAESGWFRAKSVELRTGRRVSHLDVARHTAILDNAEEVSFDKLLLATGATPSHLAVPGAHLPNLFYLHTVEDVIALHHAVDKAKSEGRPHAGGRGRAVVVGAGTLGVEVAASLAQLGLAVELLAAGAHPWEPLAGEATGRFLGLFLQRHGVTVHAEARPLRLEGDGRVQRLALDRGPVLACDFAVACVGSVANKDLLRNTPIAAGKAIIVDQHCRTSAPDVYAAGDCCAVFDPLFGKHRWFDHLEHASVTGRLAGRNMAGAAESFSEVTGFESEVFGLTVRVWGEARFVDRRLLRGTPNVEVESPHFVEVGVAADGRIAQVISVGQSGEAEGDTLRQLVARRVTVDGNEEALRDPGVSLGPLLA